MNATAVAPSTATDAETLTARRAADAAGVPAGSTVLISGGAGTAEACTALRLNTPTACRSTATGSSSAFSTSAVAPPEQDHTFARTALRAL
ncbi:hypothetical protein ACFYNZ_20785 [Streptomyces kebangsaanensis]|uniref:Uncharacterized protein n=1 Tax=Streptomyces kebangsaanensis TaxID=864058 RepID=A0ABW6KVH0_9ACTN